MRSLCAFHAASPRRCGACGSSCGSTSLAIRSGLPSSPLLNEYTGGLKRQRNPAGTLQSMRSGGLVLDHAADAVLRLHQLEAPVHVVERDAVRDEGIDVDVPLEVALH